MKRKTLLYLAMILLWGWARGGEQKEIESRWRNAEIIVDGDEREWRDAVLYLEKERLGFGLKNDSTALFVLLKFERENRRQALRFGFTVWFDPSGKNKKKFGVRFPIGMMNYAGREEPRRNAEGEEPFQPFGEMLRAIEVFGPEKQDHNRFIAGSAFGITAATLDSPEELVCELRIPLQVAQEQPYALAAQLGQTFSLGFEMGEWDRNQMRENMPRRGPSSFGGAPPGGRGHPPGGGMPPRGFGVGRPPGFEAPQGFKVWKRVTLASHGANASFGEAQSDHLEHVRVSLTAHEMPLREALQRLVSQTGVQIVYGDALVRDVRVSYAAEQVPLPIALQNILAPIALDYRVMADGQIVIIKRAANGNKAVQ